MKKIIFDTAACSSGEDIHCCIARAFGFPDHYGKNLDALYDMLTGELELPVDVTWVGFAQAEKKFGKTAILIRDLFEEAASELGDEFLFKVE